MAYTDITSENYYNDFDYAPMRQSSRIVIRRLDIFETGSYNTQYRRPYTMSNAMSESIAELSERIVNPLNITSNTFSGVSAGILTVDNTVECALNISNGWQVRRLAFVMEVDLYTHNSQTPNHLLINGWSEHADRSIGGLFDDRMEFTINTILTIGETVTRDSYGMQQHSMRIRNMYHVLQDSNVSVGAPAKDFRIQPSDVLMQMSTNESFAEDFTEGIDVHMADAHNTGFASKVNRKFNNPNHYLEATVGSFARSFVESKRGSGTEDLAMLYSRSAGLSGRKVATSDPFLLALGNLAGISIPKATFTYNDLKRLSPGVEEVTNLTWQGEVKADRYHQNHSDGQLVLGENWSSAGESDTMSGGGIEEHFAAMVGHSVPEIMMEYFFEGIYFHATNKTINREIVVTFKNVQPFVNFEFRDLIPMLEQRLVSDLFFEASRGNEVDFEVEVNCALTGETHVMVAIENGSERYFVIPSFADAVLTPMLTTANRRSNLAQNMSNLVHDLLIEPRYTKPIIGGNNQDLFSGVSLPPSFSGLNNTANKADALFNLAL